MREELKQKHTLHVTRTMVAVWHQTGLQRERFLCLKNTRPGCARSMSTSCARNVHTVRRTNLCILFTLLPSLWLNTWNRLSWICRLHTVQVLKNKVKRYVSRTGWQLTNFELETGWHYSWTDRVRWLYQIQTCNVHSSVTIYWKWFSFLFRKVVVIVACRITLMDEHLFSLSGTHNLWRTHPSQQ